MSTLIHKDSQACSKSELDLFIVPPTQTAIEKGHFVEFHPISNIKDGSPVEFVISGSGDEYMDLSSSYLYVKVKILQANGTPLPDNEPVAPVNLFLHALFSQVDASLNERVISSSTNNYAYRAYIETLLNYGEDAKKSLLTCEGFFKDNNLESVNPLETANSNLGLKRRFELSSKSQTFDMIGQLHCDIFQQNRLLLNLVDLKIKMTRSKPCFCLLAPNNDKEYRVVLDHASFFVRKSKISPGISLGHAKALERCNAKYPIDRVLCKTYSISIGGMSFMQDNVFLGPMPKRVILTCLNNASANGQYNLNPFLFDHHHANFVAIYVNGQPLPSKPLELNFSQNNYIQVYHRLFSNFNQDKGIFLTREEFAKGYTFYVFDLSPDLCNSDHLNLITQGNLRVEIKFSTPLESTISVLIYAEFENVIEITKTRHVLCDFAN